MPATRATCPFHSKSTKVRLLSFVFIAEFILRAPPPMATTVSGVCTSSSSTFKPELLVGKTTTPTSLAPSLRSLRNDSVYSSNRLKLVVRSSDRNLNPKPPKSVARDVPATLSRNGIVPKQSKRLEKNANALWNRYIEWLYQHKELGLFLDVSRIGFTDEFFQEMEPKLQVAFKAMQELEKGAIANPNESRMVGHYWLRNSKFAPNSHLRSQIESTLDAICNFADDVIGGKIKPPSSPEGRFTHVLCVGIGGSALGPQFVASALASVNPPLKIRFIDNTDPAGIDHQIAQLGPELASTLVVVTSKSGGTPETRNGLLEVQKAFRDAGLDFSKQGVAITQENSLLDNAAKLEGWVARFPMFDWVGGRTSELSAVGLLPAALQGIDIRQLLAGAALMDEATRTTVVKNNPAALMALCWYWASDGVGSKDMVVLPYKDSLLLFSRYLQQLVMESLGKEFDLNGNRVNQGLTVYGNKGSTDQHAYIQQLRDGVHNFFATFIEVLRDRPRGHDWELEPGVTCGDYLFGFLQGTRSALYANDRESITVTVQEVTPKSVGALIALYERVVGFYASLVNINAYDQPGVEAGKKAAGEVLALQKRVLSVLNEASCKEPVESLTLEEIADRCHATEQTEMIYKIISHMAANDRAIIAEGSCGSPRSIKVFLGECNVDVSYE
ncbi:glucose-6-phosphate isomerase 1, chloroplastic-like [Telopea speciosissima]|uniref:glucose-6-phosphate isomerase 1, chloroplastic-like n=1 Tax=Telopea speciosissima TaxID=54955 RepID=UPI001CC4544E|nr:glucose-6-phosphate isomerase 1, chloroplastic-like [Telopea speciosissima]